MKKLIMLLLVMATTVGFSQDRKKMQKKDMSPTEMADKKSKKMATELNLTPQQTQRIHAIYLQKGTEKQARMAERRTDASNQMTKEAYKKDRKNDSHKAEIKAVLTEAQYAQWKASKKDDRREKGKKHKKNKK